MPRTTKAMAAAAGPSELFPGQNASLDLREAVADGDTVAVGGYLEQNVPVALLLGLAEAGVSNLTVVAAPSASLGVDLLVSAGCVRTVICPYVGFEGRGAPPALQREVAEGRVERILCDQEALVAGLRAAAQGTEAAPVVTSPSEAIVDSPRVASVSSPFTGELIWLARALPVDVALLHAQVGDLSRNLYYWGSSFLDAMFAQAARKVLASADTVVPVRTLPFAGASLSGVWVDAVVGAQGSARPTGSHGVYGEDPDLVGEYLNRERKEAGAGASYLRDVLGTDILGGPRG